MVDLGLYSFSDNAIIKIRNINNNQNDLYLDDINLTFLTGINESLNGGRVSIYPNPTTGKVTINTSSLNSDKLKIEIIDEIGKTSFIKEVKLPANDVTIDMSILNKN